MKVAGCLRCGTRNTICDGFGNTNCDGFGSTICDGQGILFVMAREYYL